MMPVAAAAIAVQAVPQAVVRGDMIEVSLPPNVFRSEQLLKSAGSGLTTTIVVSVADATRQHPTLRGSVRIRIRYDLWDEIFRVVEVDAGGYVDQLTIASAAKLTEWLSASHFRAAVIRDAPVPALLRIDAEIIPFSAEEQNEARKWLLHSMNDPPSPTPGTPPGRDGAGANDVSGAFDRMIAGSVQQKPVLSWHWKVPVTR